jgi:hypothetical protein
MRLQLPGCNADYETVKTEAAGSSVSSSLSVELHGVISQETASFSRVVRLLVVRTYSLISIFETAYYFKQIFWCKS